ncbi:saccharopine dehydrogenase [Leptospira perolatii]|uniref:Saccharopine dehydrogenase n=1 Tax=Leptospira perolatii TaxID=2023191 RepID=A0A2M9ZQA3_9LEPT|nr:saccharopine dehydrogenase NADP-binding domain-containing protein [Leptospira perolatii]PJZ68981.1 saccharopine dehydrogenase [Leptospira perolatii]PJZ74151.1 saccharopine dehydrogenase [Leptospira perolatii]
MAAKKWILYGANGYTGELIAREAVAKGLKPILAGRSSHKIQALAKELSLEHTVFDLKNHEEIRKKIRGTHLVLHCAGPFVQTSLPMAKACISEKVHYLDITGEIPVYESLYSLDSQAKKSGVLLLPGVGFDIVPTDCLAASLKKKMKKGSSLDLAFVGLSEVSAGTMKSALEQLPYGSRIRKNGELVVTPFFSRSKRIQITGKPYKVYGIPWGDVFTAYISTGIPNIEVFKDISASQVNAFQFIKPGIGILKNKTILHFLQSIVGKLVKGPGESIRKNTITKVWGEIRSQDGKSVHLVLECKEGYEFTIESSLLAVSRVLSKEVGKGFMTPSLAFGCDFVFEVKGSRWLKG